MRYLLALLLTLAPAHAAISGGILNSADTTGTNARPSNVTIDPVSAGTNISTGSIIITNVTASSLVMVDASKRSTAAVDGTDYIAPYPASSWATVSALTPSVGTIRYVTNIGAGTHWTYNGTRWRPVNGRATIGIGTNVQGIANSATLVMQSLIPTNVLATNDFIRITLEINKSGTTDNGVVSVRVGTAGTTGDTAVISGATFMGATARFWIGYIDLKLNSFTSMQKTGANGISTGVGPSTSTPVAAVAITSAATAALYVSVFLSSSSTADTVGIDNGAIEICTP